MRVLYHASPSFSAIPADPRLKSSLGVIRTFRMLSTQTLPRGGYAARGALNK